MPKDEISFKMYSSTDLYDFAKGQLVPWSLEFSPDGSMFATCSSDLVVRVFRFHSGKQYRKYDESVAQYQEAQKSRGIAQESMFKLDNIDFGRRMAVEREALATFGNSKKRDESEPQTSFPNVIFDGSGNFIMYFTNHENVGKTGSERVTTGILDVSDLVRTGMMFNVLKDTNATHVVTTSGENSCAVIELDNTVNITSFKVELDGVVLLNVGVGETDGTAVVGNNIWDLVLAENLSGDFAELEGSLLGVDGVGLEAALNVVENAEVLASLVDGNNILETEGELVVTSDFTVNLDVIISALTPC